MAEGKKANLNAPVITLSPIYPADIRQAGQAYFDPGFMAERLGRDGYWCGGGARTLNLVNPVQAAVFNDLFDKTTFADGKRAPGRSTQSPRLLGWRLTFPTSPRINALWAVADRRPRLVIEKEHAMAVKRTLYQMEWLLGVHHNQRWHRDGGALPGCVVATFRTGAAPDHSPQLTTTAFAFNLAVGCDGRLETYTPEEVQRAHKSLDEFYVTAQNAGFRERLGPIPTYDHRDPELSMAAFSLASQIRFRAARRPDDWPTLDAASRTDHRAWQFAQWRQLGKEIGWGPQQAAAYLRTLECKKAWAHFANSVRGDLEKGVRTVRRILAAPPRCTETHQPQPPPPQQQKNQGYTHSH